MSAVGVMSEPAGSGGGLLRIAVLGSGGREHALQWRLQRDGHAVLALPGSAAMTPSQPADLGNTTEIVALLKAHGTELVVIGPEAPLARGLADQLRAEGFAVVGPGKEGARLEWSKEFAKDFMVRHGVATARYVGGRLGDGEALLESFAGACVVKLDGLAAGKGVVVCEDRPQALAALADLSARFGPEAAVVVEERLLGREVSILALVSDGAAVVLPPAMDHKRLGEGDTGPNTGGMGAVCPVPWCTDSVLQAIDRAVIAPSIAGLLAEGLSFRGVLYFGVMVTGDGPRLLEYNTRFGDPETQAVLPVLGGNLGALLLRTATGQLQGAAPPAVLGHAAAVVVAAPGYPERPQTGEPLTGLDEDAAGLGQEAGPQQRETLIFHAGTAGGPGAWRSAGGRILTVVGVGPGPREALNRAYRRAFDLGGRGLQLRRDIGVKTRPARAAVLFSGRGSNMAALLDAAADGPLQGLVEFCVAVTDRPAAPGILVAEGRGTRVTVLPGERVPRDLWGRQLVELLAEGDIQWVVLAGFMRILSADVTAAFPGRILNIHPADTRLHQGLHAYQWALREKLEATTITVHKVDAGLDTGPIVAQAPVDLRGADTLDEVQRRGLLVEHALYPQALCRVLLEEG